MGPVENSSAGKPLYQTDLANTPLPEILVTIHRYKVPGVVECRRGDEQKKIYLDHGRIIFASTNQRTESLGDRLVREGRLTQEQYDDSVRRLRATGKRHGVVLVEMGVLTQQELFAFVRSQIQDIIWSVFSWASGPITFTPGLRDKNLEFVKIDIPVTEAIVRGVRLMPDAKALLARVGTKITLLDRTRTQVADLALDPQEQALLDAVDGRRCLGDLVTTPGMTPGENARLLYAFWALGLVVPKEPKHVKVQVKAEGKNFR
jgi:hypothetical protein